MPKKYFFCARPTAQGLHCRMLPVIPCGSGRSKRVLFASAVFLRCLVGELWTPTPKLAQISPMGNACIYTKLLHDASDLD